MNDEVVVMQLQRLSERLDNVIATQAQHSQQLINMQSTLLMAMQQHTSHAAAPPRTTAAPHFMPMPSIMPLTPMTRSAKCSYAEFKESIGAMEVDASLLMDLQKDYPATLATAVARHVKRQQTAEHDPPLKVCMQRRGEFQAYDGKQWVYLNVDEVFVLFRRAMKRVLGWYSEHRHDAPQQSQSETIKQFDMNHTISSGIQTEKFRKTAPRLLYDALLG